MVDIIKYGNFKSKNVSDLKKQIILIHSSRYSEEYITSLKYRHNESYNKIPNYFIDQEGKIVKLLEDKEYSKFFNKNDLNKNAIFVCLENLGWLEKQPLKNGYINWIGNIYNSEVFQRRWRDYYYWQPYTEDQMKSTSDLCLKLCGDNNIEVKILGNNTKINCIENFEGIVTKSNYLSEITDLSPAFNFELFSKLLENE
jgi:N-acetyl-anhydromuramyl-L-alanine amidase AmpD